MDVRSKSPPRLIRDEGAYRQLVKDFVQRRLNAHEFLPRFAHLWRCDGADFIADTTPVPMTQDESALYGVLDSINELCDSYERSIPDGRGYRVSEEQFRREVQAHAAQNLLRRRLVLSRSTQLGCAADSD